MDKVINRLTKIFSPLTKLTFTLLVLYRHRNGLFGI